MYKICHNTMELYVQFKIWNLSKNYIDFLCDVVEFDTY